jgi:phosphopantothenoylcysteine decarboxylase/phosphopantothenate--cysteine ligase
MPVLANKNIIIGVCGGIAAYKSAELTRLLIKQGANVQIVMTSSALEFIKPMTFQALSGRSVRYDLLDETAEAGMGHIELARWADLVIVAPASANTLAKIAHGLADNLLTTLCLATSAQIILAPAMNQQMWQNPATRHNIKMLAAFPGVSFCGPASGEQACGDEGPGRMEEPEAILKCCNQYLYERGRITALTGKTVLITAGPTIEDIDPVRYISNRSSGKMGYAVAEAAIQAGARVILISGPVSLDVPDGVQLWSVRSAQQMYDKVFEHIKGADIFIATAAVADYRPVQKAAEKIKKAQSALQIDLIRNPDIVAEVAALPDKPLTIGFAAETTDLHFYAKDKLMRKKLDMIAANQVGDCRGFEQDNNALELFWREQNSEKIQSKKLPLDSKRQLAKALIKHISAFVI